MHIDILTLFPGMFDSVMTSSMLGRAVQNQILEIAYTDIRAFTKSRHRKTDDTPYGGGAGMVLMAQPVSDALRSIGAENRRILCPSPRGRRLDMEYALELSKEENLVFLCGHYEGLDERILDAWSPEEISIGDYILTGGELAAMVVIDAVARLLPDVLGNTHSALDESIYSGLLEYPQYTKPGEWEGRPVPPVLLSGNHEAIHLWRLEQSCRLTKKRRPDLWQRFYRAHGEDRSCSKKERAVMRKVMEEQDE